MNFRNALSERSIPSFMIVALSLMTVFLSLGASPSMGQDEGYDMMRVITSQWVKPYMYFVLDKSGSMHMTFDESYNNNLRWYFRTQGVDGYITLRDDWKVGNHGIGQGFWLRVGSTQVLDEGSTSWTDDGYTWQTGWVDHDYPANIYSPDTEPAISKGELIQITDYPIEGVNGIYLAATNSGNSSHNPNWRYTSFYKMLEDGSFSDTTYTFPLLSGSGNDQDVKPFTFTRVTITTDPSEIELSGNSGPAGMIKRNSEYLYIDEDLDVTAGDIVRVTGFSDNSNNGTFLIREYVNNGSGFDRFRVSKMDATGNFPNSVFSFVGNNDSGGTAELAHLDSIRMSKWYFVPATRISIAKNVWGKDLTVYEPTVSPSGYDDKGKAFYLFDGDGPTDGAWLDWRNTGDNGNGYQWHNWDSSDGAAPAGDSDYTQTQEPSRMTEKFARIAHVGLILYSGGCPHNVFSPAVSLDPTVSDSVVSSIEAYFASAEDGGVTPGGSTPTRMAIQSGGDALADAFEADLKKNCGRTYGVILMTDGKSNECNPGGNEWSSCPGEDGDYADYPAGVSDDLWKMSADNQELHIRTWAIGISREIGRCELNYTAYKGRTDASSPHNDGGMSIDDDPYLSDGDTDVYDTAHGDYAFFATSVDELRQALIDIISSMGVGDYTTSAPAVSGSVTGAGLIGMVASSDYPTWQGHLRGFKRDANDNNNPSDDWVEVWDAGEVLSSTNNGVARKIYTWNDQNNLIEVTASQVTNVDLACDNCGIDASVIDFIRGNDGNGNARSWKLGALINSTPAVTGPPLRWKQGSVQNHVSFESTYAARRSLVWVGSSDGMIHAFDIEDGTEILALLPPDMLENQIKLYSQYLMDPTTYVTGQKKAPSDHLYGVANSIRIADVWDSTDQKFRTVIYASEGPGGRALHAIDVTHPFPGRTIDGETVSADQNYDSSAPVSILWSRYGGDDTGEDSDLGLTWSIPSVGVDEIDNQANGFSKLFLGRGFLENSDNSNNPAIMFLNPATGALQRKLSLENANSYLVGNQAFADSSIWQTTSDTYHPDNLVDEAVQVDLNGVVWSITGSNWQSRSALFNLGGSQPLYYSPALGSYPAPVPDYDIFVFGSGTYYELSTNITGSRASFVPKLYAGVRKIQNSDVNLASVTITSISLPDNYVPPDEDMTTFSDDAQVISSPILLTPAQGSDLLPVAYFLVYDPLAGECVGESFIVEVGFDPADISSNGENASLDITTYDAGSGASGGLGMAGSKVIVSQSGVGEGGKAHIVEVPDLTIPVGNSGSKNVRWWMELQ